MKTNFVHGQKVYEVENDNIFVYTIFKISINTTVDKNGARTSVIYSAMRKEKI